MSNRLDFESEFIIPSPLQGIENELTVQKGIRLFIKRDDLIHPEVAGNKWRKLKHNFIDCFRNGYSAVLTFGGPFSNHIYATAVACNIAGLKSIGFIRGTYIDKTNPTLIKAKESGMDVHYLLKSDYSKKDDPTFLNELKQKFPEAYIIPEGGNSELGMKGMQAMVEEIETKLNPDYIIIPSGTSCSAKGIHQYANVTTKIIAVNALKYDLELEGITVWNSFHFGGFAKANMELVRFINHFKKEFDILLDPLYTAKSMYAIFKNIENNTFDKGTTIVAIHTGGLQGINAFNLRHKDNPEMQINLD